jgi:hypothetical protein
VLAVKLALGTGGKATDHEEAVRTVAHQPFGRWLVALLAAGLAGYAGWRLTRAALGRGPEGRDNGWQRLGGLGSALFYTAICVFAVEVLLHGPSESGTNPDEATGGVLGWPAGTWLVGMAGLALVAIGVGHVYLGLTQKFLEHSKTGEMGAGLRRSFAWAGTAGYVARGTVFGLAGAFLIKAAVEFDPKVAVGLDGALAELVHADHGPILLGLVAAGLLGYAAFSFAEARYLRI